jgi:hypothetical protein
MFILTEETEWNQLESKVYFDKVFDLRAALRRRTSTESSVSHLTSTYTQSRATAFTAALASKYSISSSYLSNLNPCVFFSIDLNIHSYQM